MISVSQAIEQIDKYCFTTKTATKRVQKTMGMVLAADVLSPIFMPPFRQSSMDGYAILHGGSEAYKVVGEVQAGNAENTPLKAGEALRIFTGARVPDAADTVVMQEHVTRKGDYITVDDLINEVGKDATRFIMLNRSSDVELDFDFDSVKEKSKDNPLFYVQYCYARISSVFRHLNKNLDSDVEIDNFKFDYSSDEIKILKKISEWPKCIDVASSKLEPHRIPVYLYELASEFHSYWNLGKDNPEKRFINEKKNISLEKLVFLKVISNVIKSGMNIVGVDTPEKM